MKKLIGHKFVINTRLILTCVLITVFLALIMYVLIFDTKIVLNSEVCEALFNCSPENYEGSDFDQYLNTNVFQQYVNDEGELTLILTKSQTDKLREHIINLIHNKAGDSIKLNSDYTSLTIYAYKETVDEDMINSYYILDCINVLNMLNGTFDSNSIEYILKDGITDKVWYSTIYPENKIDIDLSYDFYQTYELKPGNNQINDLLSKKYGKYEIIDSFYAFEGDNPVDAVFIVKTKDGIDILSIFSHSPSYFGKFLYAFKEYATNIKPNMWYMMCNDIYEEYCVLLTFILFDSEDKISPDAYKTVKVILDDKELYLCIYSVTTHPCF